MKANPLASVRTLVFLLPICGIGANAAPIIWLLSSVTFRDGGMATGSFVYDAETNQLSDVHIETPARTGPPSPFPPYSFRYGYAGFAVVSSPTLGQFLTVPGPSGLAGTPLLLLDLKKPMTDAGGTITLKVAPCLTGFNCDTVGISMVVKCFDADCTAVTSDRPIVSGAILGVQSIPEPSTAILLGASIASLAMARRIRRRQRHQSAQRRR